MEKGRENTHALLQACTEGEEPPFPHGLQLPQLLHWAFILSVCSWPGDPTVTTPPILQDLFLGPMSDVEQ